ncbi:MAG: hypothetical protein HQK50_10335 [Oligoflexia bacterium]|nr:hypothetical protein [Oligoflexia bacterium]MBF0365959.1 hypothetical protein [Oligoflexia bacterium]
MFNIKIHTYFRIHIAVCISSLLLFLAIGCGRSKLDLPKMRPSYDKSKSQASKIACQSIHLPSEISFNGEFLKSFIQCASNINEETGKESLEKSITLLNKLDVSGIDSLIALLLFDPNDPLLSHEKSHEHVATYPLLKTMMVLTERGSCLLKKSPEENVCLNPKAKDPSLQQLLLSFDPSWSVGLATSMSSDQSLAKSLDLIAPLLSSIEGEKLLSLARELLKNQHLRRDFTDTLLHWFQKGELYNHAKSLATLERSVDIPLSLKRQLLADWLNPRYPNSSASEQTNYDEHATTVQLSSSLLANSTRSDERFKTFLTHLNDQEKNVITDFVSTLIHEFLALSSSERLSILERLSQSAKNSFQEQEWPIKNMLATIWLLKETKAKDLRVVINRVLEILENDPRSIGPFNSKIGSSKIHSMMESLLLYGGAIPDCQGLNLEGLTQITDRSYEEWSRRLQSFLLPSDRCRGGLPPLAAAIFSYIEQELSCQNQTHDGNPGTGTDEDRFCPKEEEIKALALKIQQEAESDSGLISEKSSDDSTLREFLLALLKESQSKLKHDPYYLRWKHLARGGVKAESLDEIINNITTTTPLNAYNIARLDEKIAEHPLQKRLFFPNFLENLINEKIKYLLTLQDQFSNMLVPGSDLKIMQLFSGTYVGGPFEQILSDYFYLENLPAAIEPTAYDSHMDLFRTRELLSRLRAPAALFKNFRLDRTRPDEAVDYKFLGEKGLSVEFENSKLKLNKPEALLGAKELFNDKNEGHFRLKQILLYGDLEGDLIGKDIFDTAMLNPEKAPASDIFVTWVRERLHAYHKMQTPEQIELWTKIVNDRLDKISNLNEVNYFDRKAYSPEEVRKLLLFYSQQMLVAPALLPDKSDAVVSTSTATGPKNLFLSIPSYRNNKWSTFLSLYPKTPFVSLYSSEGNDDITTLAGIDEATYKTIFNKSLWSLTLDKESEIYRLSSLSLLAADDPKDEIFKILSTLNLLAATSESKPNFMPLLSTTKSCWNKASQAIACPITFPSEKYAELKNYINQIAILYHCPYISNAYGFSPTFTKEMARSLALKELSFSEQQLCEQANYNLLHPSLNSRIFKPMVSEKILHDLLRMGKNPKLKATLAELGAHIRHYKLLKKYAPAFEDNHNTPTPIAQTEKHLFALSFINSSSYLYPLKSWAYIFKKSSDNKGLTLPPGLLSAYINFIKQEYVGKYTLSSREYVMTKNLIENALDRLGSKYPKDAPTLSNPVEAKWGILFHFVKHVLIPLQDEAEKQDLSVIDYFINVISSVHKHPYYLEMLGHLFSYPQDTETPPIYNSALPMVVQHLRDKDPNHHFSWNDPGMMIFKQFFRAENMLAIMSVTHLFSPQEITRAVKSFSYTITHATNSSKNISLPKIVNTFFQWYEDALTTVTLDNKNIPMIDRVQKDVMGMVNANYPLEYTLSLNSIFDSILSSHQSFNQRDYAPLIEDLEKYVDFFFKNGFDLLAIYQDHQSGLDRDRYNDHSENYFQQLMLSYLMPLHLDSLQPGLESLVELLDDPGIPEWKNTVVPLLTVKSSRTKMIKALQTLQQVPISLYQEALQEADKLLPATHNFSRYITLRGKWSDHASADFIYTMESLSRLSTPQNQDWNNQYKLLQEWLGPLSRPKHTFDKSLSF